MLFLGNVMYQYYFHYSQRYFQHLSEKNYCSVTIFRTSLFSIIKYM